MRKILLATVVVQILSNCGASTNILGILSKNDHKTQYDSLLSEAKAEFDAGEYEKAFKAAEAASELFPTSVDANLILGFAVLGKLGVSPFEMVLKMESQNSEENQTTSSTKDEQTADQDEDTSDSSEEEASETSTSDTLGDFGNLLGLTEADFLKLGTLDQTVTDLPVIIPSCPSQVRLNSEKLAPINLVISRICPFIPRVLLVKDDERQNCQRLAIVDQSKVKERLSSLLFLWSIAHLVEAVSFHNVLTYKTTESEFTNLELRVNELENIDVAGDLAGVETLIETMTSTTELVEKVLDVDGNPDCGGNGTSQLQAVMFDLFAVGNGFSGMEGMPESVTAKLNESINSIKKSQDDVNDKLAQSNSLQQDFSKKMAKSVSSAITNASTSVSSPEQKDQLCSAYSSISGDASGVSEDAPELCN